MVYSLVIFESSPSERYNSVYYHCHNCCNSHELYQTTPCSHLYFVASQIIQVRCDFRLECEATAPATLFHQRDLASPPASPHSSPNPV